MGIKLTTPIGRVLWSDLTKPDQFGSYGVKIAFPESEDISELEKAIDSAGEALWGKKTPKKALMPVKDGNLEVNDKGQVWATSKDMRIIRFKTKRPPVLVNQSRESIMPSDIYSGCYVKIRTDIFAWKQPTGAGVSCRLEMLQFVKDGDRIGGPVKENVEDVFSTVETDDEENPWG